MNTNMLRKLAAIGIVPYNETPEYRHEQEREQAELTRTEERRGDERS